MSRRNSLEAKRKRREEREKHSVRVEKDRALQARINYLMLAPPDTYEDLEEEVEKAIKEAVEE